MVACKFLFGDFCGRLLIVRNSLAIPYGLCAHSVSNLPEWSLSLWSWCYVDTQASERLPRPTAMSSSLCQRRRGICIYVIRFHDPYYLYILRWLVETFCCCLACRSTCYKSEHDYVNPLSMALNYKPLDLQTSHDCDVFRAFQIVRRNARMVDRWPLHDIDVVVESKHDWQPNWPALSTLPASTRRFSPNGV